VTRITLYVLSITHYAFLMLNDSHATSVMVIAGEASGDKHGANLVSALKRLYPQHHFNFFGSGGIEMQQAGVEILIDVRNVAIVGILEIIKGGKQLWQAYRTLLKAGRDRRPDVVVLIDWPDMNLKLAKKFKRMGLQIVYYISPQVWAWRSWRIRAIKRDIDKMLVILPFEADYYHKAGVAVEFVGHPLLDAVHVTQDRKSFCAMYRLDPDRQIISLLPGSRRKEVRYILPQMLDAVAALKSRSDLQFVLPMASTIDVGLIQEIIGNRWKVSINSRDVNQGDTTGYYDIAFNGCHLKLLCNDTYNAVGNSLLAVVASGTATLETAILGTPLIIVYRVSALNWRILRPMINTDVFGLVNLIAGAPVAPELIQYDLNGNRLSEEIIELLSHRSKLARMRDGLGRVRAMLGDGNPSERAAQAIMELIRRRQ